MPSIKVRAPATTANLGSSFDCLGIALDLFNDITIRVSVQDEYVYNGTVSSPKEAPFIFNIIDDFMPERPPLKVIIENNIPLSRGLGSSSAAIASTLFGLNELFNNGYDIHGLLNFSLKFEPHPDNLAPSFLGGMVISSVLRDKVLAYRLNDFNFGNNKFLFFIPDYSIDTETSRKLLFNHPIGLSHSSYVEGINLSIANIISFIKGDVNSLKYSMNDRVWHHPQRSSTIKFMDEIFEIAMSKGAYGVAISGSGPSVVMVVDANLDIERDLKPSILAMIDGDFLSLKPALNGVRLLWQE